MSAIIVPTEAQIAACEGLLLLAEKYLGQREVPGAGNNPFIIECLKLVAKPWWAKLGLLDDETAWCSAAAHRVLLDAGLPGTGSAAARSYLRWGDRIDPKHPIPGCLVVFSRGLNPAQGHVALFKRALDGGMWEVRGGNQGNGFNDAPRAERRVLGCLVPSLSMLTTELTS